MMSERPFSETQLEFQLSIMSWENLYINWIGFFVLFFTLSSLLIVFPNQVHNALCSSLKCSVAKPDGEPLLQKSALSSFLYVGQYHGISSDDKTCAGMCREH